MPTREQLKKFISDNKIDLSNPNGDWALDVGDGGSEKLPRDDYSFDQQDIDSQDSIDKEFGSKFGGGKFGGHGASGSTDGEDIDPDPVTHMPEMKFSISDKVKNKARSLKEAPPEKDTATSSPITSSIDKIFAAYRGGDKRLLDAGVKGRSGGSGGSPRDAIEAEFDKPVRRTAGMKYEVDNKYDPTADFAAIDHGAAIASGVKWDPSDHEMRAKQNAEKKKAGMEAFDMNYRTAHDLDTLDDRDNERNDQRKFRASQSEAERADRLMRMREQATNAKEKADADRALKAEIASGNQALRASLMQMQSERIGDKKSEHDDQELTKLSQDITNKMPEAANALQLISDIRGMNLDKANVGYGKGGFPAWLAGDQGRAIREKAQQAYMGIRHSNFGSALTEGETKLFDRAVGAIDKARSQQEFMDGINYLDNVVRTKLASRLSGARPEIRDKYFKNFEGFTGGQSVDPRKAGRPAPSAGGLSPDDADFIKQYEAKYGAQ